MGSRMMHLIIADEAAAVCGIRDRAGILLGSIAPDAVDDKTESHFQGQTYRYRDGAPMEYGRFAEKYRDRLSDAFILGYLSHLIADEIWSNKVVFSGFLNRLNEDKTLHARYHQDFRMCNAKLHVLMARTGLYESLCMETVCEPVDEVDAISLHSYKQEAIRDFHYPQHHITDELQVFTLTEIQSYVEQCTQKVIDVFQMIRPWLTE